VLTPYLIQNAELVEELMKKGKETVEEQSEQLLTKIKKFFRL